MSDVPPPVLVVGNLRIETLAGDDIVDEVTFDVRAGAPLDGRALRQIDGVVVLGIQRADGSYEGAPV